MIGTVTYVGKNEKDVNLDINVRLSTDFGSLSYVYVVKNKLKQQLDSLQTKAIPDFKQ
jgi:rod shape-determining protein MreC